MKKTLSLVLAGVMAISTLAGCTNPSTGGKNGPEIVKVGVIAPISGPAANYGEDAVNAYSYIVDKFNSENSGNFHISLIVEDGKCDGKSASSAVQKLISIDQVQIIVGGFCSAETIAAGKIAQPNKVVMISPASSSPEIANIGDYIFRFYNDAYVTKKLSDYMTQNNAKNVFVLSENSDAMIGFLNGIKSNFKGTVDSEIYQSEEKDFDMLIKKNKSKIENSDYFVFLPNSDSSTISIVNSLDKEGLLYSMKGKIVSNEIVNGSVSYGSLKDKLNGIKTTQLVSLGYLSSSANDIVQELKSKFEIKGDPLFTVLEADAMQLALDGVSSVGNDGTAIKNYFTSFSANKPRQGYFGDYYFTPSRDAHGLDFLVYEIQDGKLVNGK